MENTTIRILLAGILLIALSTACKTKVQTSGSYDNFNKSTLIYLNSNRLAKVKELIHEQDPYFVEAYKKLMEEASKELNQYANPVTHKTKTPPSGNKHDYMSVAVYRWPNPDTENGFPWILKDGEINPMTSTDDYDRIRLQNMFSAVNKLSMAYYFSEEEKYADKARSIINVWFINDSTRVNPNIRYGQGIPGEVEGRRAGFIEWKNISSVITTIQILSANQKLNNNEIEVITDWISDYYNWIKTNPMGIENDNGLQNHSTNYDYQMVGLARYLGLNNEVQNRLEAAKTKRISTQIEPDGRQPRELGRTKSIHYSSMNLLMMSLVAELGMPLGVDLWNYQSPDGQSMKKAFDYLLPFVEGKEEWPYIQITEGGVEKAIEQEMKPLFSIASTIFGEELLNQRYGAHQNLSYMQRLQYPPLFKIED